MISTRQNSYQIKRMLIKASWVTINIKLEINLTGSCLVAGWPRPVFLRSNGLYVHTLAWDVGILVSSRNWNIPRITWSIIPIVQESKGHAKNIFFGPIQKQKRKDGGLSGCLPPSPQCTVKDAEMPLSFPSLPALKGLPGWHHQCWNKNFIVLRLSLSELNYTRKQFPT